MTQSKFIPFLLAALLLITPVAKSLAAPVPTQPVAQTEDTDASWQLTPELWAQGIGALVGFATYSLFVAPGAGLAAGAVAVLGTRVVAATLAGAGAVAGTFVYDRWNGQPLNYAYFWHRGGFVAGVAAGVAAFGVLGYPIDGGATWLVWAANRTALLGAGIFGAWWADRWYATPAQAAE